LGGVSYGYGTVVRMLGCFTRRKNMYFGFLLLSITMLIQIYDNFSRKHLIYCDSLAILLKNCVEKRFQKFLEDPFLLSAAVSHPYFKTV